MPKRVLDVGNCAMDHGSISQLISSHFDAQLVRAHDLQSALAALRQQPCDLVLINRRMDADGSDGIELVRQIKADLALANTPVMLLTNFPEYQQQAVAAGAEPGFGKRELGASTTLEKLEKFLGA